MGATAGIMMAGSMAAQGASSLATGISQSQGYSAQADYTKRMSALNEQMSNLRAEDAIKRGDVAASQMKQKTSSMIGSQRAALAAQGVDVNDGSAAEVQADTAGIGELDALTIKNNAWREAWGYKVESVNATSQANMTTLAAENQSRSTLLTGGLNAIGSGLQAGYYFGGGGKK